MKVIEFTDKEYPQKLLEIKDYPKRLYVIGNEKLLNKNSIGIVGARECTPYGAKFAQSFAKELSRKDICIVSGMAIGIDTSAHFGAVREKGRTIAVLGCGFNKIYPKENEELFHRIINNNGCVISEYAPNVEANLSTFPHRNRIISGLSMGVLVVEAKGSGGTLVTANYAKKYNRKIFCIPSNIDSKLGKGSNKLIQDGAKLVVSIEDILEEFEFEKNIEEKEIEPEYIEIYNAVSYMPININLIAKKCNLSISDVTQKLLLMELKGYVKSLPANEYVRL